MTVGAMTQSAHTPKLVYSLSLDCTYNDQLFKAGDTFPAEGEDDDADCNVW